MTSSEFKSTILQKNTPLPGSTPESFTYKLTVKKKYEGLFIVDFFCLMIPQSIGKKWKEKIKNNNLRVNGSAIDINYIVKAGDVCTHTTAPKLEPDVSINIELLYDDDDILIINKPSPLPVHASGRFIRNTLLSILEKTFPLEEFKLTHRIDANTTGIVLIAKNKTSANAIRQQFENKSINKKYIALVEGIVENNKLTLTQSIGNEVLSAGARKINATGKESMTEIEVINRFIEREQSLIEVTPLTGRTNQIRLHLAAIGHPIVGDIGYKDSDYFKNHPFTYDDDQLYLHANQLSFIHPTTKKKLTISADLPAKFPG